MCRGVKIVENTYKWPIQPIANFFFFGGGLSPVLGDHLGLYADIVVIPPSYTYKGVKMFSAVFDYLFFIIFFTHTKKIKIKISLSIYSF
jgi:hypothetical protein